MSDINSDEYLKKLNGDKKINIKYTFEYVKNYFKEKNCQLLETEYKRNHIKMRYICECGNEGYTCFKSFLKNVRCIKCTNLKKKKMKIFDFDYVYEFF